MALSPSHMTVVNTELAKELEDIGKRLIELGMALRQDVEVEISYTRAEREVEGD